MTTPQTPTPQTDEWCDEAHAFRADVQVVSADFARQLERDLAAAQSEAAQWKECHARSAERVSALTSDLAALRARAERMEGALTKIRDVGNREERPGHHNGALHLRCRSCLYRWAPGIEPEQHDPLCAALIARAALEEQK